MSFFSKFWNCLFINDNFFNVRITIGLIVEKTIKGLCVIEGEQKIIIF